MSVTVDIGSRPITDTDRAALADLVDVVGWSAVLPSVRGAVNWVVYRPTQPTPYFVVGFDRAGADRATRPVRNHGPTFGGGLGGAHPLAWRLIDMAAVAARGRPPRTQHGAGPGGDQRGETTPSW